MTRGRLECCWSDVWSWWRRWRWWGGGTRISHRFVSICIFIVLKALAEVGVDSQVFLPDLTKRGSSQLPELNSFREGKKWWGFFYSFPNRSESFCLHDNSLVSTDCVGLCERKTGLTQSSSNSSTMLTCV